MAKKRKNDDFMGSLFTAKDRKGPLVDYSLVNFGNKKTRKR